MAGKTSTRKAITLLERRLEQALRDLRREIARLRALRPRGRSRKKGR